MFHKEAFLPSGDRANYLDDGMHSELAKSFEHLAETFGMIDPEIKSSIMELCARLDAGEKFPPLTFRQYYHLVSKVLEQDYSNAKRILAQISNTNPRKRELKVHHFGHPSADQTCLDLIHEGLRVAPISDEIASNFVSLLNEGLSLMQETLPKLHAEILGIVHEIVLLREPHGDKSEFHGASHYQFWGLLLLNPKHHSTPLEIIEVLAHEASHSLLFGLTIEEPLVLNSDTDLYSSPLRQDERPMDGIYHATYVSARMCMAMEAIAGSGKISKGEKEKALRYAKVDRDNYKAGLDVVLKHGQLSKTGEHILAHAREWMAC